MSQAVLDYLKTQPLFRGLGDDDLGALLPYLGLREASRGNVVIFDVGDTADGAYVVRSGTFAVELPLPNGAAREVARLEPGAVVGELALIEPAPRSLRLRSLEPGKLIFIDLRGFRGLRDARHPAAYKLVRNIALTVCDRLRDTTEHIEQEWRGEQRGVEKVAIGAAAHPKPEGAWGRLRGFLGGRKGGAK